MTNPVIREIEASDTFKAPSPRSAMTDMQARKSLGLEFIEEATGKRRIVEIEGKTSHEEAFRKSGSLREAGEVLLRVIEL